MNVREKDSWMVTANADNATATATKAAPTNGLAHFVSSISASFSAAVAGKQLLLKQDTTELGRWYVHNHLPLAFDSPIKIEPNKAVSLELAASGTGGQIGAVTLTGYTL